MRNKRETPQWAGKLEHRGRDTKEILGKNGYI